MTKTNAVNIANPPGGSPPSIGDNYIRTLAKAVAEVLDVDHSMVLNGNAYDGDDNGKHKQVTLLTVQSAKPTLAATDKGMLYIKGATPELYFEDAAGNEKQITAVGKLNIAATDIANDLIDSQHYAAGSIDNEHLAADIINGAKIADDAVDSEHIAAGAIDPEHVGNVFGAWQAKSSDFEYTATTDGFVSAVTSGTGNPRIESPTGTIRAQLLGSHGGACVCPVRKGDTWKAFNANVAVYWLPIGA